MKLISKIQIKEFRSIRDTSDALTSIENFNAFAGLNNSGKSNILRALNAFFSNRTDANTTIGFSVDYNRFDLRKKTKNKAIEISVAFALPDTFRFRSELSQVNRYLGDAFTIKKRWSRGSDIPDYFLNDSEDKANQEERQKIDQFLSLINFRYIPNRVLPIDIIKSEHRALRDILVRRLGKKGKESLKAFDIIQNISSDLIENLSERLKHVGVGSKNIRLDTPKNWADMIFAFGYRLGDGRVEIEDVAQGSGIQSLLMFETLYLIDKDYFQQFGWRQASIWAIEEPESSLHQSLEAQVASFLREISVSPNSRLQIFTTTHSEIMMQYADKQFLVEQKANTTTIGTDDVTRRLSVAGITKYTHPILFYPTEALIVVDGKYDVLFLKKAFHAISPQTKTQVKCLGDIDQEKTGGEDDILEYIKRCKAAISCRPKSAPVIIVLDWESKKFQRFKHVADNLGGKLKIFQWNESSANPRITKSFTGTERFYPDHLIEKANSKLPGKIGKTSDNKFTISKDDYESIKKILFEEIEANGINRDDLVYAMEFVQQIIDFLSGLS